MKGKVISMELVMHHDDFDPLDDLGKYTDKPEDYSICRQCEQFFIDVEDNHDCIPSARIFQYFTPVDNGFKIGSDDFKRCAMFDYTRAETLNNGEWGYIYINLKVGVQFWNKDNTDSFIHYFTSNGIGGVESDCGEEYIKEIAEEELEQIKSMLSNFDNIDMSDFKSLIDDLNLSPEINYSM
jgi:hypothetical protein